MLLFEDTRPGNPFVPLSLTDRCELEGALFFLEEDFKVFSSSSSVDRRGGRIVASSSFLLLRGGCSEVCSATIARNPIGTTLQSSSMMMSLRRRSQEDDKEEDFVNKAPFVVFSLKRNKYNLSLSNDFRKVG